MDTAPSSWFKHSSDSLSEPDIKRVKQRFGKLQGYAMYYITIELMVKNGGSIRDTDLDLFCEDYALTVDEIQDFFSFCTGAGIFVLSDAGYTCDLAQFTIERRAHIRSIKSEAGKKSAQARQADPGPAPKPIKPMERVPIQEVVECWNDNAKSFRCAKVTSDIEKAIRKQLKDYSLEEIQQGIENYHAVINDNASFFTYKWNLAEFLSRANGFPVFSGDRDEIVGKYRKTKGKENLIDTKNPTGRFL